MDDKTHILHITHEMSFGGTQQVIRQLVQNLDSSEFHCEITCIDGQVGALGEQLQSDGLGISVLRRKPGFDLTLLKDIRKIIKIKKFDIIHCHQYTPYVYGFLASRFTGTKLVFTEHGRFHPDTYSWKRRIINQVFGRLTDSIVAISAATRQALVRYEWFSEKQIDVIYNGIQPSETIEKKNKIREQLGIPDNAIVFGTIARFDPIKNIPMMIEGLRNLRSTSDNAYLLLVGDGPERAILERLVEKFGISQSVIFTGFQKDTAKYMSIIDVYLLTSFSEGTSMTLLEAMSSATCSIVTAVGGNIELIENEVNGIVIESQDTKALSSWMLALAHDPKKREQLGNSAAEKFIYGYTTEIMIKRYSAIYQKVTGIS